MFLFRKFAGYMRGLRYNPYRQRVESILALFDTVCIVGNYSERIIRDRANYYGRLRQLLYYVDDISDNIQFVSQSSSAYSKLRMVIAGTVCLLYTSDAAD